MLASSRISTVRHPTIGLLGLLTLLSCSEFKPKADAEALDAGAVADSSVDVPAPACVGVVCNDDNLCTNDSCDPDTGECIHVDRPAGSPCDDGQFCTTEDSCTPAGCVGEPLSCDSANFGCLAATCDEEADECVLTAANDGTTCADDDLCTSADTCQGGECVGAGEMFCAEPPSPCATAECDPKTGECTNKPLAPGAKCDDGDPCTVEDSCEAGSCFGALKTCGHLDEGCFVGVCQKADGVCISAPAAVGTPCDDGSLCTSNDACAGGLCVGLAKPCDVEVGPCQKGACDQLTGECTGTPLANGTTCEDGDQCTAPDTCSDGECKGGATKDCSAIDAACLAGICVPETGVCTAAPANEGGPCDDGQACTTADACKLGGCFGEPVVCSGAGLPCHVSSCKPATGECTAEPDATQDGEPCDDGLFCTIATECLAGACEGVDRDCSSADKPCQVGQCDDVINACVPVPSLDGTACDDGKACTSGDQCEGGGCTGGTPTDCSGLDTDCEEGHCSESTAGCSALPKPNGTGCSDGLACTADDICTDGACAGVELDCTGLDTDCQVGECSEASLGCAAVPNADGTPCSDGLECTGGDSCQAGKCAPGVAVDCPCPGPNRALSFEGGCATISGGPLINSMVGFTIELWIKTTSPVAARVLDQRLTEAPGENDWSISYEVPGGKGQLRFHYGNVTGADSVIGMTDVNLSDGEWHHVALTRDGSTVRWWVDGESAFGGVTTNMKSLESTTDTAFGCGRFGAEEFEGSVDEVRISDFARYKSPFVPPGRHLLDAGTTALFHLDEATTAAPLVDLGPAELSTVLSGAASFEEDGPPGFTGCCGDGLLQPGEACEPGAPDADGTCDATACDGLVAPKNLALDLDGKDGCVIVPGDSLLNAVANMTVELWLKTTGGAARLLDKRITSASGETDWSIQLTSTGHLTFFVGNESGGESALELETPIDNGDWHHVAIVVSQLKVFRWYLNGVPQSTVTISGAKPLGNSAPLRVGCGLDGEHFDGLLDSVRISDSLRYVAAFEPPATLPPDGHTVLLLTFDQPILDSVVPDLSSGMAHGQLSAAGASQSEDVP